VIALIGACAFGTAPAVIAAIASPPDTLINSAKPQVTKGKRITFTFNADVNGATFECRRDAKPFSFCTPPKRLATKHLKLGRHTFAVRALNANGTDPTPAKAGFKVVRAG
jgi:hypothetical protein